MKKLGLFLAAITLSFSTFAQVKHSDLLLQSKVATSIDNNKDKLHAKAAEAFYMRNIRDLAPTVESFFVMTDADIQVVHKAINDNEDIENTMEEWIKKHPHYNETAMGGDQDVENFEKELTKQATTILSKYSKEAASGLLTYLELMDRDDTNDATFNNERSKFFYAKLRSELKLGELNKILCVQVVGKVSCPVASVVKKKS